MSNYNYIGYICNFFNTYIYRIYSNIFNKYYNKLLKKCKYNSNRFKRLNKRRINIINNYFNKTAKLLIDYLDLLQIKTLVIGLDYSNIFKNKDIKYPINFEYLYNRINLLCNNSNIELVSIDEFDTSYGSIFNYDHSDRNHNRRITNRLYMTDMIGVINCDVNSAINIMLKYKNNALDNMFNYLNIDSNKYYFCFNIIYFFCIYWLIF